MTDRNKSITTAVALFVIWMATTWWLEGRIETLLRPDADIDRLVYAIVANLLIGILCAIILLRFILKWNGAARAAAGFGSLKRTAVAVVAGFVLGLGFYALSGGATSDPIVILNAFAQVLVVSAAEVIVCWAVLGCAFESALQGVGRWFAVIVAAVIASMLFGVYHFAHSAPFNSVGMVAFLSAIGLVTSLFFFVSRDVYGTIVFHNFLGVLGVVNALAAKNLLQPLTEPQPRPLGTAIVTILVLMTVERFALRR